MAAMTQANPVTANTDFSQMMNFPGYNMMVKQEIVDPAYINETLQAPEENNLLQKVKRAYTRKPKAEKAAPKAKKVKKEPVEQSQSGGVQTQIGDHMKVQKRKRDRFKGTTEEEVLTRVLPDHIKEDLDILIVGINPGLTAAYIQHHYAGPGNHFWKCLHLSGIIPQPMNAMQDAELLNYGIGFTNIVARTTRGSADLTRKEIAEGGEILKGKMLKYLPKIAVFNGKGIYEVFCGHKNFYFGLQPEPFPGCPDTCVFVNPSSSARCTQLPRAVDKVPFYEALKRVRDYIRQHGSIEGIDRSLVTFPDFKLVTAPQKNKTEVKDEPKEIEDTSLPQTAGNEKPAQPTKKKPTKPRKPRAPKVKKEISEVPQSMEISNTAMPHIQMQPINSQSYHHEPPQHHAMEINQQAQQQFNHVNHASNSPLQPQLNQQPSRTEANPHHNQNHMPTANNEFGIKQELMDPAHTDQDLAAALRQNFTTHQDLFNLQQQSMMQRQNMIPPNMMMQQTAQSMVKQERPDWAGYGMMPGCIPAGMQYPYFWGQIPCPTTNTFMTNPYNTIPNSQLTATLNAMVSHPSTSTAAMPTYSSPQEASSPAMSSQSNLTQASLDSLPKADSAKSVANWLQALPQMTPAPVQT